MAARTRRQAEPAEEHPDVGGGKLPQLGGEASVYHIHTREGEPKHTPAGNPELALKFTLPDLANHIVKRAATGNFIHSLETAPASAVRSGELWYPKVHEAVQKSIRGRGSTRGSGWLSAHEDRTLAGSALVAAVSPNMDWESSNIHALSEMRGMKQHHWDAITSGTEDEAKAAVAGLSISKAPRSNLVKAARIIAGEHPDAVLPWKSAPKTHSFMHNIADPDNPHFVTIDGRAYDTLTNRARPWEFNRGLQKGEQVKGAGAGYPHAAGIVKDIASEMGISPSSAQAISWEHVKFHHEQAGLTKSGKPRSQGPVRRGQPYFDPHTGESAIHDYPSIHMLSGGQFR